MDRFLIGALVMFGECAALDVKVDDAAAADRVRAEIGDAALYDRLVFVSSPRFAALDTNLGETRRLRSPPG